MADDPNKDQTFEELEGEVRGFLDQAETLTEELRAEVGAEPPPAGTRDTEFFESTTDSEASMDAQMAQVDSALKSTAADLGAAPPPAPSPAPTPAPAKSKTIALPPKGAAAPPAAAPSASTPAASAEASAAPSAAPAQTVVLPSRKAEAAPQEAWADRSKELVAGSVENVPFPVEEEAADAPAPQPAGPGRLSIASDKVLGGLATVLDAVDRPFTSISYQIRWWLGWVALILAGAAIFVLVFAVL